MAIEINQNLARRRKTPIKDFFLIVGIVLLVLSGGGYFYLWTLNNNADATLNNITQEILQMRTDDVKNNEKEVSDWSQKIKDYNLIFNSHVAPSNILALLERDAHPQVRLDGFEFVADSPNNPGGTILKGLANDFASLQQQIFIYSKEPLVEKINLINVSLTKEGKIIFEMGITFSPDILILTAKK
jgi:hypothetical protein